MAGAGNYEEKKKVCLDCQTCQGKPPLQNNSNSPEAVQLRIVGRIERLVIQINSGQPFDWNAIDYLDWKLIEVWKNEESKQELTFKQKLAAVFEALTKQRQ